MVPLALQKKDCMIVRRLFPETKELSADWTGKERAVEQEAAAASIALES